MGFVLGGLLQGFGGGLVKLADQKREEALISLKRQFQKEDEVSAEARDVRQFEREGELKVGLLSLAAQHKKAEGETDQMYKERLLRIRGDIESKQIDQRGKIDERLKRIGAQLDTARDAASIKLNAEIDAGKVKDINAAEDGTMVVTYNDGRTVIQRDVKLRATGSSGDGEGTTISEARGRAAGDKPKPAAKPAAKPAPVTARPGASLREQAAQGSPEGMANLRSDAEAEAFVRNPANKGKAFIGPDGKRYRVP